MSLRKAVATPAAVLALVVVCSVAAADSQPTATLTLVNNYVTDTWQLFADCSQGDNAGIAGYALDLGNVDLNSIVHHDPIGGEYLTRTGGGTFYQQYGFTVIGYDPNTQHGPNIGEIFAAQLSLDPASLIYGVGQQAGSLPSLDGPVNYDAHVFLANGSYAGGTPYFFQNMQLQAYPQVNVWEQVGTHDAAAAQVEAVVVTQMVLVPEPATMVLLAAGAMALLRRRRQ